MRSQFLVVSMMFCSSLFATDDLSSVVKSVTSKDYTVLRQFLALTYGHIETGGDYFGSKAGGPEDENIHQLDGNILYKAYEAADFSGKSAVLEIAHSQLQKHEVVFINFALYIAARNNNTDAGLFYLASSADPIAEFFDLSTALEMAAQNGNEELVIAMLKKIVASGAKLGEKIYMIFSAIPFAASHGHPAVTDKLIKTYEWLTETWFTADGYRSLREHVAQSTVLSDTQQEKMLEHIDLWEGAVPTPMVESTEDN